MSTAQAFLAAARVPHSILPQKFGLWTIERRKAADSILGELGDEPYGKVGWPDYTLLRRVTLASLHLELGEIVMEDSRQELRRHLPIWMAARGRVLKTGLGMGCVVRGLLLKPEVEHIDVVEIDADIIRVFGAEFVGKPRVTLHHADALDWDPGGRRWDFAWHDIHSFDEEALQVKHGRLMVGFAGRAAKQGAWAFPREAHRAAHGCLLGSPRRFGRAA